MRTLLLIAAITLCPLATAGQTPSEQSFNGTVTKTVGYRYLLSLPAGYDAAPERRWPLLLFLHGAGERGDTLANVAKHGPPKLLRGAATLTGAEQAAGKILAEKFIVLSPQCPAGAVWDEDALFALLDDAMKKHRIDPARVYLTGLSMGGYGSWSLLGRQPERFAAVAPICGGGRTIELYLARGDRKTAFASVGVWAFHGAKDPTVPLEESQRMIAACKRAGMKNPELAVYPDATHDSWTATYANPELYAWLLRHERASDSAKK